MYSRGVCRSCAANLAFCLRIHGILVATSDRIASSFSRHGDDTLTLPSGGNTESCRFFIGLRTTNASILPICKRQELVLMLVLDDLEQILQLVIRQFGQ